MKYPKDTIFSEIFFEWIDKNSALLSSMTECEIQISPGSGMQNQEAIITITDDKNEFETNWKYSKSTFPSRIKALAKVMQQKGIRGKFFTMQYVEITKIKKV